MKLDHNFLFQGHDQELPTHQQFTSIKACTMILFNYLYNFWHNISTFIHDLQTQFINHSLGIERNHGFIVYFQHK